jgi:hypothetical protein
MLSPAGMVAAATIAPSNIRAAAAVFAPPRRRPIANFYNP